MTQPLALPNYSSLGSLVTETDNFWTAAKRVKVAGWSYLGGGATAQAHLSPRGDRVIKLVRGDDGNRATLDAALAHPDNPHLPTVYGFLDMDEGHYAVELEVLENHSGQFGKWEGRWSPGRGANVNPDLPSFIQDAEDCPMKAAIVALHEAALAYPEMCWDCHAGNVMVRPETGELVLNDLLYGAVGDDAYDEYRCECERCGGTFHADGGGGYVDGENWCGACFDDHAIFCEIAQEFVAADEDDAAALDAFTWLDGQPWSVRQGNIAASNRDAAEADGWVWDEAAEVYVEANLHAVLTAIQGIARDCLEQHTEPRLPLRLAA